MVDVEFECLADLDTSLLHSCGIAFLDDFEFALMACMVLVSPDRGGTINIAEHRALGTIQECLAAILETKLHKDGKDIKYFSACLYLLTRLRSFSELLQPMWETILDSR